MQPSALFLLRPPEGVHPRASLQPIVSLLKGSINMAADAVVSRELKSLQEELSTAQRERVSPTPPQAAAASGTTATPPAPPKEAAEGSALREQLRELVDEVTTFFEEAEKNIAAHPAESVVGALLVGALIGYLLARR